MDFGTMLGDSFEFTKEAVVRYWFILLVVPLVGLIVSFLLTVLSLGLLAVLGALIYLILYLPVIGYTYLTYRGERNPPDIDDIGTLFVDGLKLFIVELIWAIPIIIVALIFFGGAVALMMSGSNSATAAGIGTMLIGVPIFLIVAIVIALFATMGAVRFARTDSFGEAFNFSAILAHIGRIGWGSYIIALLVIAVVIIIISIVLGIIPIIGWIISAVIGPAITIFAARYITLLYDSAPAPA